MQAHEVFENKHTETLLKENGLGDFESLWNLQAQWVEEPNVRRGGWSGVVKRIIQNDDGTGTEIYIKRQEGHISKTLSHPCEGILTLKKEYTNIQCLKSLAIPTLDPLYFGYSGNKAVLATFGLCDHTSLDHIHPVELTRAQRRKLLSCIAGIVKNMHIHRLQHNCLFPKHIFVKLDADDWDVRIIDLEKTKRTFLQRSATHRDLSTLYRHADSRWSKSDRVFFFRQYCEEQALSPGSKKIWRKIAAQSKHKRQRIQH